MRVAINELKEKQKDAANYINDITDEKLTASQNMLEKILSQRDKYEPFMSMKQTQEFSAAIKAYVAKIHAANRADKADPDEAVADKAVADEAVAEDKGPGMVDKAMGAVKTQARETYNLLAPETQQIFKNIKDKLMGLINRTKQPNNQQVN